MTNVPSSTVNDERLLGHDMHDNWGIHVSALMRSCLDSGVSDLRGPRCIKINKTRQTHARSTEESDHQIGRRAVSLSTSKCKGDQVLALPLGN